MDVQFSTFAGLICKCSDEGFFGCFQVALLMEPRLSAGLLTKYLGSWRGQDRGGLASMYRSLEAPSTAAPASSTPRVPELAMQEAPSMTDAAPAPSTAAAPARSCQLAGAALQSCEQDWLGHSAIGWKLPESVHRECNAESSCFSFVELGKALRPLQCYKTCTFGRTNFWKRSDGTWTSRRGRGDGFQFGFSITFG